MVYKLSNNALFMDYFCIFDLLLPMQEVTISLSQVFSGQAVGIKEVNDGIWLVTFMDYDLGYFDEDSKRFEPLSNPFGAKVLPMS